MQSSKVCETSEVLPEAGKSCRKRRPPRVDSQVNSELRRLRELTKGSIPDDKRKAVMPLLVNIAFQKVKLDEARRDLIDEHIFTEYDNGGGQSGLREHPGFAAYNKLFTTFQRGIRQLTDLMPQGASESDALLDYVSETRYE